MQIIAERIKDHDYEPENDYWKDIWLKYFTENLNLVPKPNFDSTDQESQEDWMEDVLLKFCSQYHIYRNYLNLKIS